MLCLIVSMVISGSPVAPPHWRGGWRCVSISSGVQCVTVCTTMIAIGDQRKDKWCVQH